MYIRLMFGAFLAPWFCIPSGGSRVPGIHRVGRTRARDNLTKERGQSRTPEGTATGEGEDSLMIEGQIFRICIL